MLRKRIRAILNAGLILLINSSYALAQSTDGSGAQDVMTATNDFSSKMLDIFKGPLVKIVAGIVLFVGVGGLLRGRHQIAVSCGVAFILLLSLPIILKYFGG